MRRFNGAVLSLIFIVISFYGCTSGSYDPVDKTIARKWKLESVNDLNGNVVKKVGKADFLVITDKNNKKDFTYSLEKENIKSNGGWSLKDSSILFTYAQEPVKIPVDSAYYIVEDNTPGIVFLNDEKTITKLGAKGFQSELKVREFVIKEVTSTRMVLSENGVNFTYSYTPKVLEGSASLESVGRGLLGLVSMIFILFIFSSNRRIIPWKLVITGVLLQIIFAIGVLKVDLIKNIFEVFGNFFVVILSFTMEGSKFVFGDLVDPGGSAGFIFAFQILPTIIFFSALTSLLFYLGIMQKIVYGLAWAMSKTMKLSGAESLSTAANIFLGQTEAPLMVKPYLSNMTRSELLCVMVGGMASIAGGVMAAYIGFLGGDDPALRLFFAKHLLAASVMSAPAAIVAAKILMPQDQAIEEKLVLSQERIGKNMLEAISIGTGDGLKLAVNVAAMLLVFIALIAMVNYVFKDFIGNVTGLNEKITAFSNGRYDGFTLQFLLGYLCAPISWLMGVCKEDMVLVGQLLGEKTILNEFVAYASLGNMQTESLFKEQKSIIIATYILCGFANFASIGIQIGGIGSLAPNKRTALAELGFRALLGGTVASLLTAVIVGMII